MRNERAATDRTATRSRLWLGPPRELVPKAELWPVMPPDQTPDRVPEGILEFGRAHRV
jgi:hypothetical protein